MSMLFWEQGVRRKRKRREKKRETLGVNYSSSIKMYLSTVKCQVSCKALQKLRIRERGKGKEKVKK